MRQKTHMWLRNFPSTISIIYRLKSSRMITNNSYLVNGFFRIDVRKYLYAKKWVFILCSDQATPKICSMCKAPLPYGRGSVFLSRRRRVNFCPLSLRLRSGQASVLCPLFSVSCLLYSVFCLLFSDRPYRYASRLWPILTTSTTKSLSSME
jgi:hypothetical protein